MNEKKTASQPKWEQRATLFLGVALLVLYAYHFFQVWTYAVNVPFWDEWAVFDDGALGQNFDASWIWSQHNEHRMLTNKFLIWALYRFDGWDIGAHQSLNFFLYGGLIWASLAAARRVAPQMPLWILLCFALFLLSPLNHENHLMAFESGFHFVVLFFILALIFLFASRKSDAQPIADGDGDGDIEYSMQSWRSILAGVFCAILSAYSLSNGLVYAFVTLVFFTVFKSARWRIAPLEQRSRERNQLLVVIVLLCAAIGLWFVGWRSTESSVPHQSPFTARFWLWYASVLGAGFGFETYALAAGLACLVVTVAPLSLPFFSRRRPLPAAYWIICTAVCAMLLMLASITYGRASVGMGMSKTPRYTEFVLVFLPVIASGWWLMMENARPSRRAWAMGALWAFCFLSFFNEWSYFRYYSDKFLERQAGFECVARYYRTASDKEWRCRSVAPFPINRHMDNARNLNASFYRDARDFDPSTSLFQRR